ncbi:hypothetical protein MMC11_002677 [Xylographa trunciseda]|nr:hypothetical protein [Xylographa trunciseda]
MGSQGFSPSSPTRTGNRLAGKINSGTYWISCGSKNDAVVITLDAARRAASDAEKQLAVGIYSSDTAGSHGQLPSRHRPSHGYDQLFGDNSPLSVATVYHAIAMGNPIAVQSHDQSHDQPHASRPTIICATEELYSYPNDYFEECSDRPHILAFHAEGTNSVILCDNFFIALEQRVEPTESHCPEWNSETSNFPEHQDPKPTIWYQNYVLLQELAKAYVGGKPSRSSSTPRPGNSWNLMLSMSSHAKFLNAATYALYSALVQQNCQLE